MNSIGAVVVVGRPFYAGAVLVALLFSCWFVGPSYKFWPRCHLVVFLFWVIGVGCVFYLFLLKCVD